MRKIILLLLVLLLSFGALPALAGTETPSEAEKPFEYIWDKSTGGLPIPKLYQIDETEILYGSGKNGKSIATSGCGAVSIAMVGRYLSGSSYSPRDLFVWAADNGYYRGNGFSYQDMLAMAEYCGFTGEWLSPAKYRIKKALRAGKPVIAWMGAGLFTDGGHYIVLTGWSRDGMISVNDPNSEYFSTLAFSSESILHDARAIMICELPETGEETAEE
ncbi:MAG: C39 family peptidase [Eubacteriales bacterium]|nr:C39 family peptidase [Eubacteriales bacterium]MDD3882869.1 C39 family peptidase [Eubacteriales bacterium]MDD4512095.1 C39 family peptidase [Eubacteriales bacterium]